MWDTILIYILFIGVLLIIGKAMKTYLPFLNRIVLPTALLGGIIGLLFSSVFIPGSYNLDPAIMTKIVYHGLAIGFIALSLKQGKGNNRKKVWSTGMIITSTYALQGFIGILLVLIFFGDKFIGAGMLLALGFGQGPGLATSFGSMWNEMLNIGGGENFGTALGASYAFIGFVFGGTVGVLLINLISRRRGAEKVKRFEDESLNKHVVEFDTVKEISVMDSLTVQFVIVALVYFLTWATIYGLDVILKPENGGIGEQIFGLVKGFNFIIGIGYALLYRFIFKKIENKGVNVKFMKNDYILANISSLAFNIMITAAVLTITIEFLSSYGLLLLVVSAVGGILTLLYMRYITHRVYPDFKDEYYVGLFGMLTGTASTGVALLKGIDKQLESPVAEEMVLGSGTAILIALPLFACLMLPSFGWGTANANLYDMLAFFGVLAYFLVVFVILMLRSRTKRNKA